MATFDAVDGWTGAHATQQQKKITELQTSLPTALNLKDVKEPFFEVHVTDEIRLHLDRNREAQWKAIECQHLPVGMQGTVSEMDEEVLEEFMVEPENDGDFLADYDNEEEYLVTEADILADNYNVDDDEE
ncbi:hypothetical protein BGZ65_006274 [Modicella reniformis]|uniref:Uncharacterized protein n=1 Tax=Modicella reniformis TaxID=1440133 RepID=A0A9P6JHV2_9FUNG|nr:hypothetical protein BGZ65_006274 [Modicella reniformis]